MGTLVDLPGELNLLLYVGRAVTITLTFPVSLAGRTFTASLDTGTGTPITPTVTVATNVMSFPLTAANLPAEYLAGTLLISETTSGNVPYIAGTVRVTRNVGTPVTSATVQITTSTVNVSVLTLPSIQTFATNSARDAALPTPAAGTRVFVTTGSQEQLYDGTGWVIMSELAQPYVATITSTVGTLSSVLGTMTYHRSDGYLDFTEQIIISNNGTGSQALASTLPVTPVAPQDGIIIGHFREVASTGNTGEAYWNIAASRMFLNWYNNTYPGATGYVIQIAGRYKMQSRYS